MTTAPPGWYPNPDGSAWPRWWDGYQWAADQAPSQSKRPKHRDRNIAIGAIAAVLLIAIVGGATDHKKAATTTSTATTHLVTYTVGGTAHRASLTIENEQGGTEQLDVALPWTRDLTVKPGAFVYLSAQNPTDVGAITCTISIDGLPAQSATSDSDYGIAGCDGHI